jgi:uncharacterized protein YcaQ
VLASATSIPMYNYYILPVIRHNEIVNKIDGFDKRLTKIEKWIDENQ